MVKRSFFAFLILFAANASVAAMEMDIFSTGDLTVRDAWARVILTSRPGAVYMTIANGGHRDDRLIGARTPVAERAELHTHIKEGDVVQMREVEAVDVPAGGEAAFSPGGHHVMLFGLDEGLSEGDMISVTLEFEMSGALEIKAMIMREAPQRDGQMDHGDDSGHQGHGDEAMEDEAHSGHGEHAE